MFMGIEDSKNWICVKEIKKGWSDDKKYYIETINHQKLLLRIADIALLEKKQKEYEIIKMYARIGFPMSTPVTFGICDEGKQVYMILTWVEGKDLEEELPQLSVKKQYELGRSAGEILRKIHGIKVSKEWIPNTTKIEKKLKQLKRYEQSQLRVAEDEIAIDYIKKNINKMWSVPPVYQHGDFHPGNLIWMPEQKIGVIDFNRWEIGDPYEEFYKLESFGASISVAYCVGQIDRYFEDKIPELFWEVLAVYVAHSALYSIKWAQKFGQEEIDNMRLICKRCFQDYHNFTQIVPTWYDEFKAIQKEKE